MSRFPFNALLDNGLKNKENSKIREFTVAINDFNIFSHPVITLYYISSVRIILYYGRKIKYS